MACRKRGMTAEHVAVWLLKSGSLSESGCIECHLKCKNRGGYSKVRFERRQHAAHRFVYAALHGEIPDGLVIRHACDNPCCISPDHLLIGTYKDNTQDCIQRGRFRRGKPEHWAKLTESAVREIREKLADGASRKSLGVEYGVGTSTIRRVANGQTWKHV